MTNYGIESSHHYRLSSDYGTIRKAQPDISKLSSYAWVVPGAKVQLKNDCGYMPRLNNPVQGSTHACEGVIDVVKETSARPVVVNWNNGKSNQYFFEDLELCDITSLSVFGQTQEEKKGKLFNKRDIVFLRAGFKTAGHRHPALGTVYQCPGTVETAKHDNIGVWLVVKWYNSLKSEYSIQYDTEKNPHKSILINAENQKELEQFVKENPNFAYRLNKDTQQHDNFGVFSFFRSMMGIEEKLPEEEPDAELPISPSSFVEEYIKVPDAEEERAEEERHENYATTIWSEIQSEEYNENESNR